MLPIRKQLDSNDFSSRNGSEIKYIVIHDTGNYKDTDEGNAHYFCEDKRKSSAHYFVDEDSITQIVEDYNSAWHVGDGHARYGITNRNSLGVEMCNSGGYIAEVTINNSSELVRYLMQKYGIPIDRVVRHYDASRKNCPANMSANNWAKWHEFKEQLNGTSSSIANMPKKTYSVNYCLEWQRFYNKITQTKAPIKEDSIYGPNTQKTLDTLYSYIKQSRKYKYCLEFQKWYNATTKTRVPLITDGLYGLATEKAIQTITKIIKEF